MDYLALGYLGLFLVCFLSATILPLTSEGVLLLFLASEFDPWMCLLVASVANSLGGLTNYWLGMFGNPEKLKKRLKNPKRFDQIDRSVKKYGYWLALLSWTPILGDPLTVALGYFRVQFWPFLVLMIIGKVARYALLIFLWNQ